MPKLGLSRRPEVSPPVPRAYLERILDSELLSLVCCLERLLTLFSSIPDVSSFGYLFLAKFMITAETSSSILGLLNDSSSLLSDLRELDSGELASESWSRRWPSKFSSEAPPKAEAGRAPG